MRMLDEGCLETNPENLPDTAFDENIDIIRIRRYFTSDTWVRTCVKPKRKELLIGTQVMFGVVSFNCVAWEGEPNRKQGFGSVGSGHYNKMDFSVLPLNCAFTCSAEKLS